MAVINRPVRTKAQQRATTTRALLDAGRSLFAERGYAQVSLADVVSMAGVTKGALYHYFGSKHELFRAVVAEVHDEVAERVAAAAPDADPWTQLLAGCRAFLTASTESGVQQIMLVDAPAVLGWSEWRRLDAESSARHLEDVLARLIDDGVVAERRLGPLVSLLSGAMNEAVLALAHSDDLDGDLDATMAVLTRLLESLRH